MPKPHQGLFALRPTKIAAAVSGFQAVALVAFAFYGVLFLRSMWGHPTLRHLCDLLWLWQTQVAGLFAVAAAWLAGVVVLHQTRVTEDIALQGRRRRAAALRAVLPLIMVELGNYAQACGRLFIGQSPNSSGHSDAEPVTVPALPSGLSERLLEMIEASDDLHARPLTLLALRLQVQNTRAADDAVHRHDPKRVSHPTGLLDRLIEAAEIYARAGKIIEYARGDGKSSATETTVDDIKRALWFFDVDPFAKSQAEDRMALLSEHGEHGTPWPLN